MQFKDFNSREELQQFYSANNSKSLFHPVDVKIKVINIESLQKECFEDLGPGIDGTYKKEFFRLWFIEN